MGLGTIHNRVFYVLNNGNAKGAAALGIVSNLGGPCHNGVGVSNGGVGSCGNGSLCQGGLTCLPRGPRAMFLGSAISNSLRRVLGTVRCGGRRHRRGVHSVSRGLNVASLLAGRPCSLDNNRRRGYTLTGVLLSRPAVLLLSRPAGKLSTFSGSSLLGMLGGLGSSKVAIIVMARSIRFTTINTSEYTLFFSNRVVSSSTPGSFFTRGGFCAATTGHVTHPLYPATVADRRTTRYYHKGKRSGNWGVTFMCFSIRFNTYNNFTQDRDIWEWAMYISVTLHYHIIIHSIFSHL